MPAFPTNAVERAPALIRDQVAAQIRDAIVNLRLVPGQVLVERQVCETTTASRATVREALRQLESEGLVSFTNGRGTMVATLSADDAREIYEVRSALEGLAGRLFAVSATNEDRAALLASLAELERVAGDIRAMLVAKSQFYDVLLQGARNSQLRHTLGGLNRRVTLVRAASLSRPGRWKESLSEVRAICAAAVDGDADKTEQLCREHIQKAAAAYLLSDSQQTYVGSDGSAQAPSDSEVPEELG